MEYINYLLPTEISGIIIISIQSAIFFIWFAFMIKRLFNIERLSKQIGQAQDVTLLTNVVENAHQFNETTALAKFDEFTVYTSIPEKSLIHSHLKTLFVAGFSRNNLDVRALISNTTNKILSSNQSYRSVLSLFIVLGLLGTLLGLATSLSKLSIKTDSATNDVLSDSYRMMLEQLSGSFTPSIIGVFFTILGVSIFALFQKRTFNICHLLEKETLGNWSLRLFPATPQHLSKQLERSEKQLNENLEAAQKVAEFANEIRSDAEGLKQEISETRLRFKDLRLASENLVKFSESFTNSMRNFPDFQNELSALNKTMLKDSELLQVTIGNSLQSINQGVNSTSTTIDNKIGTFLTSIQNEFNHLFTENKVIMESNQSFLKQINFHFDGHKNFLIQQYQVQHEQINSLLKTFKLYEDSYLTTRGSIDDSLIKTLSAVQFANQKLGEQNENTIIGLADSIGKPINQILLTKLGEIAPELSKVSTTLSQTKIPLDLAAERMSAITQQFDQNTQNLVIEFNKQNQQNHSYIEGLNEITGVISKLNENLINLTLRLENIPESPVYIENKIHGRNDNNKKVKKISKGTNLKWYQRIFWG